MVKITHGLLEVPRDSAFISPIDVGLRSHSFLFHKQRDNWTLAAEGKTVLTLRHTLNAFSEQHSGRALQLVECVPSLVILI